MVHKYLLKAIILFTVWTIPTVPVPIWNHCILIAEPAVHIDMCRFLSVEQNYHSKTLELMRVSRAQNKCISFHGTCKTFNANYCKTQDFDQTTVIINDPSLIKSQQQEIVPIRMLIRV